MIQMVNKVIRLDKPNGTFIVFGEYDSEEVFDSFLEFIHQSLGAEVNDTQQHPYSRSAKISFPFGEATAICQSGVGCAIRVDPSEDGVAKNIVDCCLAIK